MVVGGAKSSETRPRYDKIPLCALERIARCFEEGGAKFDDPAEYAKLNGRCNWQDGDDSFFRERYNHAIHHALLHKEGDRSEDHLAKAAWGFIVLMWHEEHPCE